MADDDLAKQRNHRTRLLRALHEATKGSTKIGTDYYMLAATLGLSRDETNATMDYLVNVAGWARFTSFQSACMSAEGVLEMERRLEAEKMQEASGRIPSPVIAEIARAFSEEHTHAEIDNLFRRVGAPEPPPGGSKLVKVDAWLRQIDADPRLDALAVFGRLLEDFMESQPPPPNAFLWDEGDYIGPWHERRARVNEALAARGLSYHSGGKMIGGGMFTPSKSLADKIRARDIPAVNTEFERAYANITSDPAAAVTAACAILEATCRTYIAEEGLPLPADQSLHPLWRTVQGHLGLSPSSVQADDLRRILGGLASIVDGVGAYRTHAGSAHGRDSTAPPVEPRHARLAVHAAHTVVTFVLETWETKGRGTAESRP